MELIDLILVTAALLCSVTAGFLVSFAFVVMPGIGKLGDLGFLKAFKEIDRVIQNNQPVFIFVWIGSAVAMIASALVSVWQMAGFERVMVLAAALIYVVGVQVPTVAFNIPLNNSLQESDLENLSESELNKARIDFEIPWIRWNSIRTFSATLTAALLIVVCLRT